MPKVGDIYYRWSRGFAIVVNPLFAWKTEVHQYEPPVLYSLEEFPVVRVTPQGVWLDVYGKRRWVSNYSIKKFAYPDKTAAWRNYILRSEKRLSHLLNEVEELQVIIQDSKRGIPTQSEGIFYTIKE